MRKQRKSFFVLVLIVSCQLMIVKSFAQNVNIPDAAFKAALVANTSINTNADGEIQVSEATATVSMGVASLGISDLTGIEAFTTLVGLDCSNNQLTSLNVSANTALGTLNCLNNQLTSLNISTNTAIDYLYCNFNQLTSLNISANTALTRLYCNNNQLTSLNVSANTALTRLYCQNNLLTSLNVSTNTAITDLDCRSNQLTSLNVTANTSLTTLNCLSNQLTSLNVSANTAITNLSCSNNSLSSLNVANGNNTNLTFVATNNPTLTCIQVDNVAWSTTNWTAPGYIDATASFSLSCISAPIVNIPDAAFKAALVANTSINTNSDNEIQVSEASAYTGAINVISLNISNLTGIEAFTALTNLNCGGNQLTSLNFSANTALTTLDCGVNQLTSFNVSANTALTELYCDENQLTSLNVSANSALAILWCYNNQLTGLDVSNNTALNYLDCSINQITGLNVNSNTALTNLWCWGNLLTILNVSNNTALTTLHCENNSLSLLNVSTNPALTYLDCNNNQLTSLDVRNGNNINFTNLNALTNPGLTCIQVDNTAWSTANWTNKPAGASFSENCSAAWCTVNIPDANFKAALLANAAINTNSDGEIQCSEATIFAGSINVSYLSISNLTGIEAFTAITSLDCSNNSLSSLNVSLNTALTTLKCDTNSLASLNVSQNTGLTLLYCNNNLLTSLNVNQNTALTDLTFSNNSISSIDLSNNTALRVMTTNNNPLTGLNVSQNTALIYLQCQNNSLSSLNVSNNTALVYLYCDNNSLSSLNVSLNTVLAYLTCNNNSLSSLNIANGNNTNFNLSYFNVTNNPALSCIQVDNVSWSNANWTAPDYIDATASFSLSCTSAPIVNIPDAAFKAALVANTSINTNQDGEIQVSEAEAFSGSIDVSNQNISDLIGIEAFTALTSLRCYSNSISSLDLIHNTALTFLQCGGNPLYSLDVSNYTALTYLDCRSSLLYSLNVANGNNTNLSILASTNPNLFCIQVDNVAWSNANWTVANFSIDATASFSLFCEPAPIVNIPDAVFKAALIANTSINTNQDGEIQVSEASSFTGSIDVQALGIYDLTGIEAFTAITTLQCQNNYLSSLNLSNNTSLSILYCFFNTLTSLNLTNNTSLTLLGCSNNYLGSLDLSHNTALYWFNCTYNNLSSLNVANGNNINFTNFNASNNPNLTCIIVDDVNFANSQWSAPLNIDISASFSLNCISAPIVYIPDAAFKAALVANTSINTNLDGEIQVSEAATFSGEMWVAGFDIADMTGIEAFTALTSLSCYSNQLTSLDLSANTALTSLFCDNNQLTSLDLSANSALAALYCNSNQLTSLLFPVNTTLTYLNCSYNQFTNLDISANSALIELNCSFNFLSGLDISSVNTLENIYCGDNQLTSLDVSGNSAIVFLDCGSNQITTLDFSSNPALAYLTCDNNLLTSLNLSANTVLSYLDCDYNQLTTLNIKNGNNVNFTYFDATGNTGLTCIQVDNAAFMDTNWTSAKDVTASYSENCISCNITLNISTTKVSCNSTNNGTATVIPVGGTTPYSYLWDNNSVLATATTLVAGTYSVTVADANGCTATAIDSVNWVGPCDTKVRTLDCGSTVTTLAKYIYCDAVSGATDYEWEFTATDFSFAKTKGSNGTAFYLANVAGIESNKTYDVRVRAFKNGVWGNFSITCQITTPPIPTTKVRADYCGVTVNTLTQYVYCDAISGAADYEWEFVNIESNYLFTRIRGIISASMSLSSITGLEFGKTYDVRVKAKVGTQWGDFGTVCTITTPAIPSTKVRTDYCGITATSLSQYLYCDAVSGAADYEWEFVNEASAFSFAKMKGSASTALSLSTITGIKFGTTYDVKVRVKLGLQWGNFATICQITTPAFPTTKVRTVDCGITATSLTQYIYCDAVKGVQDYEWKFENTASGFSFTKVRGLLSTAMNLSWITGITNSKTYDVSVKVKIGGEWGNFGTVCQITTPSGARLQENVSNEESKLEVRGSKLEARSSKFEHPASNLQLPTSNFELSLMPNPVQKGNSFNVFIQSDRNINETTISVFNIIGQIVYAKQINIGANSYSLNIEQNNKFTSGLFIIQTEINGEVKRLKLIVE